MRIMLVMREIWDLVFEKDGGRKLLKIPIGQGSMSVLGRDFAQRMTPRDLAQRQGWVALHG